MRGREKAREKGEMREEEERKKGKERINESNSLPWFVMVLT